MNSSKIEMKWSKSNKLIDFIIRLEYYNIIGFIILASYPSMELNIKNLQDY